MVARIRRERRGFTLVEVLIVVVILGILAATVLPQFASTNDEAKESAVIQSLQTLRSQIQLYRFQHKGVLPLVDDTNKDMPQLTSKTDIEGEVKDTGEFGPYILGQLPPNPFNGLRTVKTTIDAWGDVSPDDSTGWIYNTETGDIKANTVKDLSDKSGTSQTVFEL